jgi:regulator of sigma E protease
LEVSGAMDIVFGIIIGLIVLVILVVVHELGHAIIARRNGVEVEEFGIGFPPKAWSKKLKNGILFSLNWLPLGGFVRLKGEHDSARGKGTYGAASFWQKTKILLAGVVMNWVVAAILLTALALFGLPKVIDNQFSIESDTAIVGGPVQIVNLAEGYPAEDAGMQVGDKILSVEGQSIESASDFIGFTQDYRGQDVLVVYERDSVQHEAQVTLRDNESGAVFGAGLGQRELLRATWSAPIVGVATTAQFTWVTLQGLGGLVSDLFSGLVMQFSADESVRQEASEKMQAVGDSVAGPVGILGTIFPSAQQAGFGQLVFLSAIISLTLAIMNILPIPALDGGRWFTMAIFKLLKKELTKEREETIQTIGFLALIGLIVLITVSDVSKFF